MPPRPRRHLETPAGPPHRPRRDGGRTRHADGLRPHRRPAGGCRRRRPQARAFIGIPCQVYALRALEASLGFERIYVIGTPCSDNTTTESFHSFLNLLAPKPDTLSHLEFRTDFKVEPRCSDGRRTRAVPFLSLPISQLPPDFFPLTRKTSDDDTNRLADITPG